MGITIDPDSNKNGEVRFLKKFLSEFASPIIFDIGANTGCYSNYILSIKHNAQIYAFEPHPLNYKELLKLKDRHNNINIFNLALSSHKGDSLIFDYANRDGSPKASLYKDVIEFQYQSESISHKIEMTTIDDFVKEHDIRGIDLLKIDAEGHELEILRGAKVCLLKGMIEIIQFEFNHTNIISRSFLTDFFILLDDFVFYRLLTDGWVKLENIAYNEVHLYQNIVAVRSSRTTF